MDCEYPLQSFEKFLRRSQSLSNDCCQTILFKAVFEHFKKIKDIAALLLSSKSFQNSSFGPNFVVNFFIDRWTILLFESFLSPSSCLPLQFVPSLYIEHSNFDSEKVNCGISDFVRELVDTKYLRLSLRSLKLNNVRKEVLSCFFGSSNNAWPQLQRLSFEGRGIGDDMLEIIPKNAAQLRVVHVWGNCAITDAGLEHLCKLSGITSLKLCGCGKITDAGLEHLAQLSDITSLDLSYCEQFTDAGLEHISKLSDITSLSLVWCAKITDEAKKKFMTALPNCNING